jgi:hypothetical protein
MELQNNGYYRETGPSEEWPESINQPKTKKTKRLRSLVAHNIESVTQPEDEEQSND